MKTEQFEQYLNDNIFVAHQGWNPSADTVAQFMIAFALMKIADALTERQAAK